MNKECNLTHKENKETMKIKNEKRKKPRQIAFSYDKINYKY